MGRPQIKSQIQTQAFQSKAEAHRLVLGISHSYGHRAWGLHKENRSSCWCSIPVLSFRSHCSWLRHSWKELLWQPITHSTSLPKALQMQHLHSVTRGWTHTHTHTPHRAAVPWLYEEWTSLQWQKTPPWPSDKAAPVQPCPEAQRWCVPGVTKLPIWTKHTHAPIHKVCDTAFQVLSLLHISLKELQICKLSYAKKPPPKHQTCFRWKQTFSEEIKQQ